MTFGRALLKSIVPALLIGPMLGLLGALFLILWSAIATGGNPGAEGIFMIAAFFGALIGLIVASPVCLVAGACLLVLTSRNRRWAGWQPAAIVGGLCGAVPGFALAAGSRFDLTLAALPIAGAVLGVIGALAFRKTSAPVLAELDTIDPEIFG
jgi:hypothetical protein